MTTRPPDLSRVEALTDEPPRLVLLMRSRISSSSKPDALDHHGDRVHLGRGMTRTLVNSLHGVRVRRLREAPHHARVRIPPCPLKVDAFLALNVEVSLMSRL